MDVLVTGSEERQGLAVIRALGAKGLDICAAGHRKHSIGFYSRYTKARCQYPSPIKYKKEFCETIADAVRRYQIPIVIPVVESTVIALDEYRHLFDHHTKLALPESKSLEFALDKKKTYDLAEKLGIDIPRTSYPESLEDAAAFAHEVGFPLIVKPRAYGSYAKADSNFDFKIKYLTNQDEFDRQMRQFQEQGAFPMLQEYCTGVGVPQSMLCSSGKIVGICQHRRGRDYPLSGGVASVVISEPLDPKLRDWTEKLMAALQWDGIAQVEYRVDRTTGRKVLFEINGRFWAPVSSAIQWGLNFPFALYRYVHDGIRNEMQNTYILEKRCRYLRGDLIALEGHMLGVNNNSPVPLPGKWRLVWEILKDFRYGVLGDVLSWTDPLPSLYEGVSLFGRYAYRSAYYTARPLAKRLLRR